MKEDLGIKQSTRLLSMLIDHIILSIVTTALIAPSIYSNIDKAMESQEVLSFSPSLVFGNISYLGIVGILLYLLKDSFNGRSIAKRIFKLQVVNNESGKAASPIKQVIKFIFRISSDVF